MRVQFDLEKYTPETTVFTRDGEKVEILTVKGPVSQPVVGLLGEIRDVAQWWQNGAFSLHGRESGYDLFMEVPEPKWEPSIEEVERYRVAFLESTCRVYAEFGLKREYALEQENVALKQEIVALKQQLAEGVNSSKTPQPPDASSRQFTDEECDAFASAGFRGEHKTLVEYTRDVARYALQQIELAKGGAR